MTSGPEKIEPSKEKFWALMQEQEPDMTRAEFEVEWADFMRVKRNLDEATEAERKAIRRPT